MKHGFVLFSLVCAATFVASCSSKPLQVENSEKLLKPSEEFEKAVVIEDKPAEAPKAEPAPEAPAKGKKAKKPAKPAKKAAAKKELDPSATYAEQVMAAAAKASEPDVEDHKNHEGRRPVKDPFRAGEVIVHDVSYFKISAGALTFKTNPFVQVNKRKSYNFSIHLDTYPKFSTMVYAVEDVIDTLMDYELMVPSTFALHLKETNQVKEGRSFFDFTKLEARYWDKTITTKNGEVEEKKQHWDILPWSQNVFSALFYMRTLAWEDGKEYAFRVADAEENHVFTGKVIRREKLETEAGTFNAIVIKPQVKTRGIFKQMGDIYFWLSDDDRKIILRMEVGIKVGTFVSEIVKYEPGAP